jgi:hypothetical protein
MRYAKIWYQLFFIVIYRFSLVKSAMNALHICKLRNGVNKTPKFLLFQMPLPTCQLLRGRVFEAEMKKKLIQVCNAYSPQPSKLLYNCQ